MKLKSIFHNPLSRPMNILGSGLLGVALLTAGCGKNDDAVSHKDTHAALEVRLTEHTANLDRDLRFLDGDRRLMADLRRLQPEEECFNVEYDEQGNEIHIEGPCDEDNSVDDRLEINFAEQRAQLLEEMQRVLNEGQIESQSETRIVYVIPSNCAVPDDERPDYLPEELEEMESACREDYEEMKPRVAVTRSGDAYQFGLLAGEARHNYADIVVMPGEVKAVIDLSVVHTLIEDQRANRDDEEDFFIPRLAQAQGVISISLSTATPGKPQVNVNIEEAIVIEGVNRAELSLRLEPASPFLSVSAESATRTIAAILSAGPASASFEGVFGDSGEDEFQEDGSIGGRVVERPVRIDLAGIDLGLVINLGQSMTQRVSFGLGDRTSTVHISGQEVLAVDIDPSNDRLIDFELDRTNEEDETFILGLASAANDIRIETNLEGMDEMDVPQWLRREVFQASLNAIGDALPSVAFSPDYIRPTNADLTISSQSAGLTMNVGVGECLVIQEPETDAEAERFNESHPLTRMEESNICE